MPYIYQSKNKNGKPHQRWRFQYRDYLGRHRTTTGGLTKAETRKLAMRVQAEHDEIRRGFRPAPTEADKHGIRPFDEVIEEYVAWGKSQGGRGGRPWGKTHARKRISDLAWWRGQLGIQILKELNGILPNVERVLRSLQSQGKSGKTLSNRVESLRSFCNWCVEREYLNKDPLRRLARFDQSPTFTRRALTLEEVHKLLSSVPDHKKILYEVALCTGLRANELRSLTVRHLDKVRNGLVLDAAWTKSRKAGFQPLPVALVGRLDTFIKSGIVAKLYKRHFGRKNAKYPVPKEPLLFVPTQPARELQRDLRAVDIPIKTPEGQLDFHALRTTFATLLVETGASVKELQTALRHSTPQLSMNVYARARENRMSEVSEAIGAAVLKSAPATKESK